MKMMMSEVKKEDLTFLAELMQAGKVKPVVDKTYPFSEIREAMRYVETGRARGKVVVTLNETSESALPGPSAGGGNASTFGLIAVLLPFIIIPFVVIIGPILAAFILNRRDQRRNPDRKGYRWGYYFSVMSFVAVVCLGLLLDLGLVALIVCALIYGALAWFFAQRRRWAWIALTILSFNPIAWIINAIYFRKRWTEEPAAAS
jgi:hypothetical protein